MQDELNTHRHGYRHAIKLYLFQALQSSLESIIENAKQALDPSDNGDVTTADELESLADKLQKTVESVVSAGLSKSHPLVAKATDLHKALRDKVTEAKVSAVHMVSIF